LDEAKGTKGICVKKPLEGGQVLCLHRTGGAPGFDRVDKSSELPAGQLGFHLCDLGRKGRREGGREGG